MVQEINREGIPECSDEEFRGAFEKAFVTMKASRLEDSVGVDPPPDEPPIVPVLLVYLDRAKMLPFLILEYQFLGTREEVCRIAQAQHKQLVESPAYRRSQNQLFVTLKTKYNMRDRDILDLLVPDASKDEREKVYSRLKRNFARVKASRQGTKS